jgi:tripartite ATP-independent transporter DctM subunit
MVEISPTLVVIVMFGGLLVGVLLGYPLFIVVGGIGMFLGLLTIGMTVFPLLHFRVLGMFTHYVLLAVPLFVFMGVMVERSGAASRLYGGLYLWFGGLRGGLAIVTILMGTILAATVGVIIASISMMALVALPEMLKRGYSKELGTGSVCAGGSLGILIPPSVMLVMYGPMAQISVGKLFMGAFIPGFVLSGLYCSYIAFSCWLKPESAPPIPSEDRAVPLSKKLSVLVAGVLPPAFIILAVLGSIFFGIATPTEAAAVGSVAAVVLAVAYHQFNLETIKEATLQTLRITSMAMAIAAGSSMFTGVFLKLGGNEVVSNLILAAPGGRWGSFALIMFITFILGMFIIDVGIIFIMVPLITPIGKALGFDPVWFALMININLQMSYMTPPFAPAIFFLRGIVPREWEIGTAHIIRGVIPYVVLIMVGLGLCVAFPQLILWLPGMMIK